MRLKTVMLMVLVLLCGGRSAQELPAGQETVKVLVARKDLATGIICRRPEELFQERFILRNVDAPKMLTSFEEVRGRQLKYARQAGDTIAKDDLYKDDPTNCCSLFRLRPGHRAIDISPSPEQIAAGFSVEAQSRVDIFVDITSNDGSAPIRKKVLNNVLGIAYGLPVCMNGYQGTHPPYRLTVALIPEDALRLETVKGKYTLHLLVRPYPESELKNVDHSFSQPEDDLPQRLDGPPAQVEEIAFTENASQQPDEEKKSDAVELPAGHKAVSIRLSPEQVNVAFVPGTRIDIACSSAVPGKNEVTTQLLAQNVLILAVGQSTVKDDSGKDTVVELLTVALRTEDKVKLDKAHGKLQFLLRPPGESSRLEEAPGKDASTAKDSKVYEVRKTVTIGTNVKIEVTVTIVSK